LQKTIPIIIERMKNHLSCSAHSIDHVMRVYNLCKLIAKSHDHVDMEVLEPAALLHDIARTIESNDQTGTCDHALLGSEMAGDLLRDLAYPEAVISQVQHCIRSHRYRTGHQPQTIEAKILFDADKLDVIGSIGIARTFMLAGQFGQRITTQSSDDYQASNIVDHGRIKDVSKHSPLMEYEYKFKHIPDKLYTQKGKALAKSRLAYMKDFFDRLDHEMKGVL